MLIRLAPLDGEHPAQTGEDLVGIFAARPGDPAGCLAGGRRPTRLITGAAVLELGDRLRESPGPFT